LITNPSNIVIIIPSYNEGERIRMVVKAIKEQGFHKIVVIDDGSTDNSMELIKKYNVIILRHLVNRGAGAATETGLKYCREILKPIAAVMIDADTQHDASEIKKLIDAHFEQGADITIGNRFLEGNKSIPSKNRFYNRIANIITSLFAGKMIHDSQSGFKVFGKKALERIIIEHDQYEHCSEILIKGHEYNFKIINVPIKVYYSTEISRKGQNIFNGIRTFINLLYSALFKNNLK
jgi:glycosyltransferase involved in cell wall biosynthesis